MKKLIALSVAAVLVISLSACSASAGSTSSQVASNAPAQTQASSQNSKPASQTQSASAAMQASTVPSQETQAASSASTADESVLDDINASLNNLGGAVDHLETVNPDDLQE